MTDTPREAIARALDSILTNPAHADDVIAALKSSGYRVVPEKLTDQMMVDGVEALIDSGLDGPDGVGWSEVEALWAMLIAATEDGE